MSGENELIWRGVSAKILAAPLYNLHIALPLISTIIIKCAR